MDDELNKLMFETQKQYKKSNKLKDKIIVLLTVLMFAEAVIFYGGFVWYESQFDYVSTEQSTETQDVDVSTSGENANAEYNDNNDNDVQGNQYNGNSVHNEGGEQ